MTVGFAPGKAAIDVRLIAPAVKVQFTLFSTGCLPGWDDGLQLAALRL